MPRRQNQVPDGWYDYVPCGRPIPETPFVAFKVPLSERYNTIGDRWTPETMMNQFPHLKLVIDLTNTDRYYNPSSFGRDIKHFKIKTKGHEIPSAEVVDKFFDQVKQTLRRDGDALIGVHCTHGINRTGYLICRYLIEELGWEPRHAIEEFGTCRGHNIERENYLTDLEK